MAINSRVQRFKLAIFDCDGVLVDSERITNRVFATMLNELGISVTLDYMFEHFVGRSLPQCLELMQQLLGKAPPESFVSEYRRRSHDALIREVKPVDGIESALDRLDLPYCVASSGAHDKMQTTLGITGLLPRFQGKLFSVTEVAHPKPAPDIYLYAASKYEAEPSACVVIEDSPTGVKAAVAAGMIVFGYSALMNPQQLLAAGANLTFESMRELPGLIARFK